MSETLYDVIGIDPACDRRTLDRAYRTLARELHPDINPDPEARDRLSAVNNAYATLSNAKRRADYDASLGLTEPANVPEAAAAEPDDGVEVRVVLEAGARRGPDLHVTLTLAPADLCKPVTRTVSAPYYRACAACGGTGYDNTGPRLTCPGCTGLGMDPVTGVTCPNCSGHGSISAQLCPACGGAKAALDTFTTTVAVPAGQVAGTPVVHRGHGLPGVPGVPRGDLHVRVVVNLPGYFVQSGRAIGLTVPVHHTELRLGATLTVPGVTGPVELTIPAGTPAGTVLVVPGGGYPGPDGKPGALHVRCELPAEEPDSVPAPVRAALEALLAAERSVSDIRAHLS